MTGAVRRDDLFEVAVLVTPGLALVTVWAWSALAWPGLLALGSAVAVAAALACRCVA